MAIQNIKCPNCNGEVQLDDTRELGYCSYCGSTIQIKDEIAKIRIEHTGKVEIDDSKRLANSLALADRAFTSGNYEECYSYSCAALECDVDNAHATFRKGLCAAYLSLSRTHELEEAVKTAVAIIRTKSDDVSTDIFGVFIEMYQFIRSTFLMDCNRSKNFTYPNFAAANYTFSTISTLTTLCIQCSDLITNDMIDVHPNYEDNKRDCLELGIDLCELGTSSLKYFSGYRQVKKGDSYVQQEVYEYASSPFEAMQIDQMGHFKSEFNNLPSTQKALQHYDSEIERLQGDIDTFNQKLEEYFSGNPELGKTYKRSAMPFVILTGLAVALILVLAATLNGKINGIVFTIIMVLAALGALALAVFTGIRLVTYAKDRKQILSQLPPDLTALKTIHDQSKTELKSVKQTKAAFVKENVKK